MYLLQNMCLKKNVFRPISSSVTLHIPTEFWWHSIFGTATMSENFGPLGTGRGGVMVHGEMSRPIDYYMHVYVLHYFSGIMKLKGQTMSVLLWV